MKKTKKKQKKRIKIFLFSFFGYSLYNCKKTIPFGGAEVQLYLLAKEISKNKNFEVNVIVGDYNLKRAIIYNGNIKVHVSIPLERSFKNYIKALIRLFSTLFVINPDILIQRSAGIETGLSTLYSYLFRKKNIYSIAHILNVRKGGVKGLKGLIYRYGLFNSSYIIAQNRDQIIELNNWKRNFNKKIKIIRSGYEIKNLNVEKKEFILWVGRCIEWKRPEIFLKLTKKFPEEKFVMICGKHNSPHYWNIIYQKASELSNVEFFNFIPFNEIDLFFQKAKIFINTSIHEGFPNTFVQAFKNKTPVISLIVNPDNILTKYKIGFSCNNDFGKMESSLKQLLEKQDLYDIYSKRAMLFAKNNNNIEIISKKWICVINEIINN